MHFALKFNRKYIFRTEPPFPEGGGGKGGSSAASDAQKEAISLQRQQWEQITNNLAPYLSAGAPALQQLQSLSTLNGQQNALNDYYNSGQFAELSSQARYQQLAGAEATGGLGSTATGNGLAAIAPTLGQQWLSGQMQNYGNLMNIGMSAATGQASAGQNYANNTGQLLQGLGAIQSGSRSGFGNFPGGAASGAISGAALGSIIPGIGTSAGAAGGSIIGGLGGLF